MTTYISPKTMMERTGYCRVQLWRKAKNPNDTFPAPVQLGLNKIGWPEEDIEAWEQSLSRVNYAPDEAAMAAA